MAKEQRWSMSGPEEGDKIDQTVLVTFDGDEIIEIREGTLRQRQKLGRQIADLLNDADGEPM